ncbi:MAG: trimethylamine methyltransferase family protein [Verrucomicrobia bacterium]|nr:trimethylamine methyltransferase family protein [Verrucomicrobiota bacterium]
MNDDTAAQIHAASLALLDDPGIRLEHDSIRELLLKQGAGPGNGAAIVRIPKKMAEEYLGLCPRRFALTDRRGAKTWLSAQTEPVFWSCPGMSLYHNGVHRPFTSADMADLTRLLDQLENVQGIFGLALDDVPPPARDVVGLKVMAENSSKHIRVLCFSPQGAEMLTEIKPVVGTHPWFSIGFTAHGPLRWTRLALEIFKRTAGHGIPVSVNGEPMAGVTGPVTLAGSAAVGNAEILAGIVINQLLEPGRPCVYNLGLAHIFDMRTAIAVTGGPENALLAKISARMGRFYNLPSASWVSTESMCPDAQAALEKMFGFHTHVASGVTNIWGVGQLESELTICPAQAVIDNEMIAFVRRYQRGFDAGADALAVAVSRSVGVAGSFLEQEHTLRNYRAEFYRPGILFRNRRQKWNAAGQKRLEQRAEEIAAELINRPANPGLSEAQARTLATLSAQFVERMKRDS